MKNSTLSDFNVISYVGRLLCPELIADIEKFLLVTIFKMATTISQKFNIVRYHQNLITSLSTHIPNCYDMWVDYDVPNWLLNFFDIVVGHFENGDIQHCPKSSQFDMWVDNDVPKWVPTLNNFYWLPFSKWPPQYRKNSTLSDFNVISYVGRLLCPELIADIEKFLLVTIFNVRNQFGDIIIYPHMKWCWNRTMLNLCGIVAAILKMTTGRIFSISGINSGHHYLPTYWYVSR
jgi:hypothetical protein